MAGKFGFEVTQQPEKKGVLPEEDFDRLGRRSGTNVLRDEEEQVDGQVRGRVSALDTLSYGAFGRDFVRDAAKTDQPFCLSISFKAPHHPTTPDPQFDSIYAGKSFTKPANFGREYGEHFSEQSQQGRQYERFHSWNYSDKYDQVMATYYQQIYAIDVAVGMIREAVVGQR